ncbi:hypothetical protein MPER_14299, partial [Moniliophthora perniciosa FA553]
QTIVPVIIDIATPPGGSLNLFNIYVALSRSAELLMEDERLDKLDRETKDVW